MKFKNLIASNAACQEAADFIEIISTMGVCELFSTEGVRNLKQNAKMWPMLTDISKQVVWMGQKHSADTWKHIITAAWRSQVFVHGIGGTLVVIPTKTSKLSVKAFSELVVCIGVFGDEQEVKWSDPALKVYEEYREAA